MVVGTELLSEVRRHSDLLCRPTCSVQLCTVHTVVLLRTQYKQFRNSPGLGMGGKGKTNFVTVVMNATCNFVRITLQSHNRTSAESD